MKWIAFSIFVSSLVISFHYVWINRFEMKTQTRNGVPVVLIINKWTGGNCVTSSLIYQNTLEEFGIEICDTKLNGNIILP